MIKAEILTDVGTYEMYIDDATTLEEGWKIVEDILNANMPFHSPAGFIVLGKDAAIKHIRIYNDIEISEPTAEEESVRGVVEKTTNIEYLGCKLRVTLGIYCADNIDFFTITEINGGDPFDALGGIGQVEILQAITKGLGYTEDLCHLVVPPGSLGEKDEYISYLKDFAELTLNEREAAKESKGDAKPWSGWKENK